MLRSWAGLFGLVVLAVIISGCSKSGDPVIGKWIDSAVNESTVEFRADGTAYVDADWNKMRTQMLAMNPGKADKVNAEVARRQADANRLNTLGLIWTKNGDTYAIESRGVTILTYKLEQGQLVSHLPSGKRSLVFHRV
ncbi:MAG TPA: hypothetical protein PLZ21_07445, partial [Armatimonadota bacterium]|nr:hypothetical protein [Armatimonadota bacterium]